MAVIVLVLTAVPLLALAATRSRAAMDGRRAGAPTPLTDRRPVERFRRLTTPTLASQGWQADDPPGRMLIGGVSGRTVKDAPLWPR